MTQNHKPTPWKILNTNHTIVSKNNECIAEYNNRRWSHDQCQANAAFIVRAVNSHDALVEALEKSRIQHNECEDPYYSCPASGKNPRERGYCDCGADEHNARIDAALALAKG